jgi:hypothetical protein
MARSPRAPARIASHRRRRQAHLDLAEGIRRRLAHHPADPQQARRLARENVAAGVALEPVVPAQPQVAGDRQEPAGDALGGGDGAPQVFDVRRVGPAQRDRTAFAYRVFAVPVSRVVAANSSMMSVMPSPSSPVRS